MGTTLEELVVTITAENQQLLASLSASAKATSDATTQMSKVIEQFASGSSDETSKFQGVFETMVGFVGGEVVVDAFKKAADVAESFFKDTLAKGVDAAIATEDAMQRLNTSLALSGEYSKATSIEMGEFADTMQKTTKYSDDAVLSASALIESLGQLDKQGLQSATKAALDMSAALGIDLNTAANLVAKAAAGHIETFTRYGVTIAQGGTQAETFANTLDALNQKFGGAAAAQLETYSGQIALLKNNYEDATKQIGFAITQNQAVLEVIKEVNKIVSQFSDALKDSNTSLKQMVGEGLVQALQIAADLGVAFDAVGKLGKAIFASLTAAADAMAGSLAAASAALKGDFVGAFEAMDAAHDDAIASFKKSGDDTIFADLSVVLLKLKDSAQQGLGEIGKQADGIKAPVNSAKDYLKTLSAEMLKLGDTGKELAKQLIDSVTVPDKIYQTEKSKLDDFYGQKFDSADDYYAKLKSLQEKYPDLQDNDDKIKSETDYYKQLNKLTEKQYDQEIKDLQAAYAQKKISPQDFYAAQSAAAKKNADEMTEIERKKNSDLEALGHSYQQAEVNTFSATANLVSAVMGDQSEAAFLIQKAAAVAQSILSTRVASAMALASPPGPPFTIPLAAQVELAGEINTAAIIATAISGMATGGSVPGIGFSDSVPTMLTPGEQVIDQTTSKMLKEFLIANASGKNKHPQQDKSVIELRLAGDLGEMVEQKILKRQANGTSLLSKAVVR